MSSRERLVIYSLLAVAILLALGRGLPDRSASGVPVPADDPVLGPASALVLRGDKGELTLKNAEGRVGWANDAFGRAYSVGFVHISKPLRRLREQPRYVEETEALTTELTEKDADYRKRLEEISAKVREVEEGSDEFKRRFAEGDALFQEYRTWQNEAIERRNKLEASHIESCYRQLIDAIEVVAERKSVDIVFRFIVTSEPFEAVDVSQALNEVRFRSVLRYPQGLDITPEVMKELGVEE